MPAFLHVGVRNEKGIQIALYALAYNASDIQMCSVVCNSLPRRIQL